MDPGLQLIYLYHTRNDNYQNLWHQVKKCQKIDYNSHFYPAEWHYTSTENSH